jgi:hypothetical protein
VRHPVGPRRFDPGAIDEYVQASELLDDAGHHRLDRLAAGDVAHSRNGPRAGGDAFGYDSIGADTIDVVYGNARSVRGQGFGNGTADPLSSPSHKGHLSI